jgi:hypothetical protein
MFQGFLIPEDFMSFFTALVTSKIAAGVLAGGTLAAGGGAAAAYTGTVPGAPQQSAHDAIGTAAAAAASKAEAHKPGTADSRKASKEADAPEPNPSTSAVAPDATGPDATGPAAFGLCMAFANGGLDSSSTAYKSLAAAASGGADVATYCKSVPVPGQSAGHRSEAPGDRPEAPGKPGDSATPHNGTPPGQAERGLSHKPASAGKP